MSVISLRVEMDAVARRLRIIAPCPVVRFRREGERFDVRNALGVGAGRFVAVRVYHSYYRNRGDDADGDDEFDDRETSFSDALA